MALASVVHAEELPERQELCQMRALTTVDFDIQSGGPFHIKLKNGFEFYLTSLVPETVADKFEMFTPEEKAEFFKRRHELLSLVARTMAFPRTAGGFALFNDKVKACLGKGKASVADRLGELKFAPGELDDGKLMKRGKQVIAESLKVFDALIWEDASVLVGAKMVSYGTYIGAGIGVAAANRGFYYFNGVQMDVGYNFETQKKFVQFSWLKQTLKGAALLFEQMITVGAFRQYQLDPAVTVQEATHIAIPPVIAYQRGENMVAGGIVVGVNVADLVAGHMALDGNIGLAGALLVGARFLSSVSFFWTDLTKTTVYKHEYEKSFADRARLGWARWFGCNDDLSSK